jgi:hypothetical protein
MPNRIAEVGEREIPGVRHRTLLPETFGVCFIEDPLAITNPPVRDKSLQLASISRSKGLAVRHPGWH